MESLRLALSFLTLLPIAPSKKASVKTFARSIKYFSLVGVVFGLANLGLLYLLKLIYEYEFNASQFASRFISNTWMGSMKAWVMDLGLIRDSQVDWIIHFNLLDQPWLVALLLVVINLCLSGGLHMDGLMDSFDGITASKKSRKETLAILKDSRTGAFGAMSAVVVILTQLIFLAQIDYVTNFYLVTFVLFIMPALSRTLMVLVIIFQVDRGMVNDLGSSLAMFKNYERKVLDMVVNILVIKVAAWILLYYRPLPFEHLVFFDMLFLPWLLVAYLVYAWLKYKLQGHNGDSIGAGLVLSETLYCVVMGVVL